ncbi:hypothetical protein O181_097379 [Austropuccinia psidii MF-1]|uniref:Uncharacterized protein n=1 Tax=Austropuccinia psidii MF-1 TaxID=1389203 RepID=A0A9Q3J960_9BASI|nr:hypothetical protein [Austropuccinia psidii MF-1]
MPSNGTGESYNPLSISQKGYRHDYGRSQLVTEGQGLVNQTQTDKLCHSDANNTILPSQKAETTMRCLSGHIQSQPEVLDQLLAAKRVPYPCISVEKLHENFWAIPTLASYLMDAIH